MYLALYEVIFILPFHFTVTWCGTHWWCSCFRVWETKGPEILLGNVLMIKMLVSSKLQELITGTCSKRFSLR